MTPSQTKKSALFSERRLLLRSTLSATLFNSAAGKTVAGLVASAGAVTTVHGASKQDASKPTMLRLLDKNEPRELDLFSLHTGERTRVVYYTHGMYIDENIKELDYLMRDRRANKSRSIDPSLYDQLLLMQRIFKQKSPIYILSGYRTAETNAKLRRRSNGVAKNSLHMEGKAADFYIPGVSLKKLRQAAINLNAGGVGTYSKSNFIHIDTGTIRHWGK